MHPDEILNIFPDREKGISKIVKILLLLSSRTMDWRGDDVNDRRYPETGQAEGKR
jgi:hypothetical protein